MLQDIITLEQQLRSLSLSVDELWKNWHWHGSFSKRVTLGSDRGAEVTVWPPELFPDVATLESDETRRGLRYFGPGDKATPTLPNIGGR